MGIKIGNLEIDNFLFGASQVASIWLGNCKIWENYNYTQEGTNVTLTSAPYTQSGSEVIIK